MPQSFNYRHLYYFWVVAKEGGIARAAQRLDMAVQTISAQVRELEKSLGVSLLRNEGRNLVLTDAGMAALHEADHIFALGELLPIRVREAAVGQTLRLISVDDIDYLCADTKYTRIAWRGDDGGPTDAIVRTPLKELIGQLDPAQFAQVHRSVIVNLRAIRFVKRGDNETADIHLKGREEVLPVSRSYLHLFRQM